jgi:ABC-2 type transport system permease protein
VSTILATPRRQKALLAQLLAVMLGGALIGLLGAALTVGAVAASTPVVGYYFMLTFGDVSRVLAASSFAGAVGAVLGAAVGAIVRNTGGAITAAVPIQSAPHSCSR